MIILIGVLNDDENCGFVCVNKFYCLWYRFWYIY